MSRLFRRSGRILRGPLKAVPLEDNRSPVPVTSLAVTAAAIAAALFLVPRLSPQVSVDPAPMVTVADASASEPKPEALAYGVSDIARPASAPQGSGAGLSPSPVAELAAVSPASQPESVRPAVVPSAAQTVAATPPTKPAADPSLFRLDVLPLLTADGDTLDEASAPPPAPAPKRATSRKTAAANRAVAASNETSQP